VFAGAVVVFGVGETLLSPTLVALVNGLAPEEGRGRCNGIGALAFTAGFMIGPATAGAALGAGANAGLFMALIPVCAGLAVAARRLARHLPSGTNLVTAA
jgi:MFS family permease